tara:strand:- start:395 stop:829 length:435 start_codon:yes stop_codon:yes gene_type:complete
MKNLVIGDKFRIGKHLPMWGIEGFTPGVDGGIYYTAVNIHKGNYETFTHKELESLGDTLNVFRLSSQLEEAKPSSLKNPKSTYYEVYNGLESIDVIELILTKEELIGALKYNILKYQLRLGKKDNVQKEIEKIEDYKQALKKLQ